MNADRGTETPPSADTLGRLYIDRDGVIWRLTTYCAQPTVGFVRAIDPSQHFHAAADSALVRDLAPLSDDAEIRFMDSIRVSSQRQATQRGLA